MSIIGVELTSRNTGASVRELQTHLAGLGAVIDPGEQTAASYGPSTVAAVRAFRQRYGLPEGDGVDAPTGRLMHVASVFAATDGREDLRAAVRTAAAAADTNQPQELYWLARYATIVGDYETAHSIVRRIPDHDGIKALVEPIVTLPAQPSSAASRQLRPPEVPYPENFYVYRRPWVDPSAVERVVNDWRNLNPGEHSQIKIFSGLQVITALRQWHEGNVHSAHRRYAAAVAAYDACQESALTYFDNWYPDIELPFGNHNDRLAALIKRLYELRGNRLVFWNVIQRRRELLSLDELEKQDHIRPRDSYDSARKFVEYLGNPGSSPDPLQSHREDLIDVPLVILAFVLAPLARAEANRARRQFDAAILDLRWVLDSVVVQTIHPGFPRPGEPPEPIRYVYARLACEFIELPFAKLLLAETMLDKADTEYKARTAAAPAPAPDVAAYQGLKAAQTYLALKDQFTNEGAYVARVDAGRDRLTQQIQQHVASGDTRSHEFQLLGNDVPIPTIAPSTSTLPGLDRRTKAHEALLKFTPPAGQEVVRETNPRVYAVLLTAQAKLEQLKAGFNSLGYLDTYVPPWRFQFLLERARYFAEHAKNAQREYLNFLSNAEREEFQELSASQNVEMEKSNVRIETARVDQVGLEVAVAFQSKQLADLTRNNAKKRLEDYKEFEDYATDMDVMIREGMAVSAMGSFISGALTGGFVGALGGMLSSGGSALQQEAQLQLAYEQRALERKNLARAVEEAKIAAQVAQAQLAVAQAGLLVAGLQRQAALLRHEFAIQNLDFLRNRVLSAEQWYRLAAAIRSVSETYFRYSIELAFLAEQAYEFEADKRINVIRFDYDLSEVGDFLAADFLIKDLDTLEQDLIVTQRQRQQHVRYVLSMAREFPEALQEIRDRGKTTFSLRLEQLEKRFPGLYNIRIGAVDVLPIALMDSTRFTLELTHLGTSQVRLKAQPDTPSGTPSPSPLNTNDLPVEAGEWLAELQDAWPVKLRVTGPETAVFSGLTRQDANAVFAFATTGQRQAFEALGAAAAWEVDFTARENQVVPGTLADLLITLTLSGYHDPELRRAVDRAPRITTATTRWLSGRTIFPDALYEFNRSGRMVWNATRDLLTLTDTLGAVRNVALLLLPSPGRTNYFGRVTSQCEVQFRITKTGGLELLSEIPQVTFKLAGTSDPLLVAAQATLTSGAEIDWDFGDGSARQSGASQQHRYAKPGRYTVSLRVVRNGRLSEFRADVVLSRSHTDRLRSPVTAFPTLTRETGAGIPEGHTRVVGMANTPADDPVIANWRVGAHGSTRGNRATFDLKPGDYTLVFVAVRALKGRLYCRQRHRTGPVFEFNGLSLASNRRFDPNGTETTGSGQNPPANPVAKHLFAEGALSPADEWTIELPLSDNAFLRSVGTTDAEQYSLAEIQDVVLGFEYETTPA
jgi:Tc toxin complex TcA C-terminal TcB-binding domain/PKD domain/Putative peptidoglycan binding domain